MGGLVANAALGRPTSTMRRRQARVAVVDTVIPHRESQWYARVMSGTYTVTMGDRGRLVVPAEVRAHTGLAEGVPLLLLETPGGLVLMTREQARDLLRSQLAGTDVVAQLLADRRSAAAAEDAA